MEDKNTEMSLDEVLSSIKKMVIDEESPVLELTDMIAEDGKIVKIKKAGKDYKNQDNASENTDLTDDLRQKHKPKNAEVFQEKHDVISSIVKEILPPILQKWMNDNLPKIVTNIVETEVKNFLYQKGDRNKNN